MAQDTVGLHRLASTFGRAEQLELHEIAIFGRAASTGAKAAARSRISSSVLFTSSS